MLNVNTESTADGVDVRLGVTRREFTALALAAGVAAAGSSLAATETMPVAEADVRIQAPAGVCDAALSHPQGSGRWPAVIMYPDVFGLRPVMREMARRLAADGFAVLVPNPFYRSTVAPGLGPDFDFNSAADRAKLDALRAPLTGDAIAQDAAALVGFLDSQACVDARRKVGAVGYCFGGSMTMLTAAAVPERVGAAAAFHGGNGLATDKSDSPHLLVPKMKARFYFGIAGSDDEKDPMTKTRLAEAFQAARLSAEIEVYTGTMHGWCMKDAHVTAGHPVYDAAEAARAWRKLEQLFKLALV